MNEWQDIESAPKDGTEFLARLVFFSGKVAHGVIAHTDADDADWTSDGVELSHAVQPTHWVPLPSLPKE